MVPVLKRMLIKHRRKKIEKIPHHAIKYYPWASDYLIISLFSFYFSLSSRSPPPWQWMQIIPYKSKNCSSNFKNQIVKKFIFHFKTNMRSLKLKITVAKGKELCFYHTSNHVLAHQNHQTKPMPTVRFLIPTASSVFPNRHSVTSSMSVECSHPNSIYSSCSQTPSTWIQIFLPACWT